MKAKYHNPATGETMKAKNLDEANKLFKKVEDKVIPPATTGTDTKED